MASSLSAILQLTGSSCPANLVSSFSSSFSASSSSSSSSSCPSSLVPSLSKRTSCSARPVTVCGARRTNSGDDHSSRVSRRVMSLLGGGATTGLLLVLSLIEAGAAVADGAEDYKNETQEVIDQVKATLELDKTDPRKAEAVANLRHISNDWVAKYRRDKKVAGKPSFSNMYSVVNAIAGHYISFGPTYPIPVKRRDRILDEVKDAEKALSRGR
ncbi:hypothetical protein CY35_11G052300 [Sphagnum magellanicum]|nr:hypothetical protein CY35_11G052300 [Sphagnum magellanicum]